MISSNSSGRRDRLSREWSAVAAWCIASVSLLGSAVPAQQNWMRRRFLDARASPAMAYDIARHRTVLFGGLSYPNPVADTWEWDGDAWVRRLPVANPPARTLHAMAYDVARERIVMFGGNGASGLLSDTWEWDGDRWTRRSPAASPSPRRGHAMCYDWARHCTVLFGGFHGGIDLADTWEWDGSTWTQRAPSTSPPARWGHALCYDVVRQRTVMAGGDRTNQRDVWEWDGQDWTQRTPPPALTTIAPGQTLAYDLSRQRVVLIGQILQFTTIPLLDPFVVWEWDGSTWQRLASTSIPTAYQSYAMTYDVGRRRTVLFGGQQEIGSGFLSETWEWDGNSWSQRSGPSSPSGRRGHAMVRDAARDRAVLFGGNGFGDTWEWDRERWTQRTPVTVPPGRQTHAMVYDGLRHRVVMFGGLSGNETTFYGDTWEWDGNDWLQRFPASSPPARSDHGMAYDSARDRIVLFGGRDATSDLSDTWEWDGSTWAQLSPTTHPTPRSAHSMAYDPDRQRTVLFGGFAHTAGTFLVSLLGDTWEWDGNDWAQRSPATSPSGRLASAMVYDVDARRTVLFGGEDLHGNAVSTDTWEWDGSDWSRVVTAVTPEGRSRHAMIYDPVEHRVLSFGGGQRGLGQAFADTWVFGTFTPPSTSSAGVGCGGPGGPPVLSSNEPYVGNPGLRLRLASTRAWSPCVFVFSATADQLALGGGCTLYVAPPWVVVDATTDASGFAETPPIHVPNDLSLRGLSLHSQAAVLDPPAPVLDLAFSARRTLVIGD